MSISTATAKPTGDIDDLALTRCVLGRDHVVLIEDTVALYQRAVRRVVLLGVFDGPADAFEALDAFDAPLEPTPEDTAVGFDGPGGC